MKVAIIHDWLVELGGAELVLKELINTFPDAEIFSLIDFLNDKDRDYFLSGKSVKTSFLQKVPKAKKLYRNFLPLMPFAIEQFDLRGFDVIISSSYAVAKGVITSPTQTHISYCHSPIRYAWDMQFQYLEESGLNRGLKGIYVKYLLHKIRGWDVASSNSVDFFIANSNFISKRIYKFYKRKSKVIHPPVNLDDFSLVEEKQDYYLTASRMVPYKKIDLIVRAFNQMPDKKLIVIGTGPDFNKIQKQAGDNITLLGYQPFDEMIRYMQNAKAFVFAAEEDFGIVPVEAQACGTPVVAFGKGGSLETVVNGDTGIHYFEQSENSICDAISKFENIKFDPKTIRKHAEGFSISRFRDEIKEFVIEKCGI